MFIQGKFVITVDKEGGGYEDLSYDNAICEIIKFDVIDNEAVGNLTIFSDETKTVRVLNFTATIEVENGDSVDSIERKILGVAIEQVCDQMVLVE